jgi:hypothetical protein
MKSKKILILMGTLFALIGCGGGALSEGSITQAIPVGFSNKVINNRGSFVEGSINGYTIKIYSDSIESLNPQEIHKGIVIKLNGNTSEIIPIQISYLNKNIIVSLINTQGDKVSVSRKVLVTDTPVIMVEMTL